MDDDFDDILSSIRNSNKNRFDTEESRQHNLEYDLLQSESIREKAKNSGVYAHNLYAALCNNGFTKNEEWPLLQGKEWCCTWRYAGGIVAELTGEGDYLNFYCGGIFAAEDDFVSEGIVTDEIKQDLFNLGWLVITEDK